MGNVDMVNSGSKLEEGTHPEGEEQHSSADEDNLEGALDDWELNRQAKDFPSHGTLEFNIQSLLPHRPLYGVDRTLYGKAQEREGSLPSRNLYFLPFCITNSPSINVDGFQDSSLLAFAFPILTPCHLLCLQIW
ncbi:hypothetical protein KC19_VG339700 [Ceratodon purpureus]|uniref:Uncharacterized protein n=1 Tax=Ceratodon purpureus TaxID=3225 RepID=A0A8T0HW85_CERPU|nr:hypothetical protein KC19_VG339700 [Ceratodon purpureus]